MDKVRYYKDCDLVLKRLVYNSETLSLDELKTISPDYSSKIIQEFEDNNIARWSNTIGYFDSINQDIAKPLLRRRYYEILADEEIKSNKRDELSERSTNAAQKSASAAERSLIEAGNSRKWAIVSAVGTITAATIAVLTFFLK